MPGFHTDTVISNEKLRKEGKRMRKEEIEMELAKHTDTILSFPNRGPWGDSRYRGNCSGWIPAYFINKYHAKRVAEVFAGSGTTYDVCRDMGVRYVGIDLNPNPPRDGILSMDILDDAMELPDGFYDADMVFLHPPYPSIHDVRYAGNMWQDTDGTRILRDIQEMNFEDGMKAVNHAVLRAYNAMPAGSYEVCLVGEIRAKGEYRSMMQNLAIPGILHQTFIKLQHNTVSGRRTYSGSSDFALTGHEMIAVIKKPSGYELAFVMPKRYSMDIRDSQMATWKDVVMAAVRNLGGASNNEEIYAALEHHAKAAANVNWKAKIRQTLQKLAQSGLITHVGTGQWDAA